MPPGSVGGELVLVPHIEGRYASVGRDLEDPRDRGAARRPRRRGGERPAPGHDRHGRARHRTGAVGPGRAHRRGARDGPRAQELAREYRAVLENILLTRGARRMAERLRDITDASQIADLSGYSPDLSFAQKVEVLETVDARSAPASRPRLGARDPRRPDAARADQDQRRRGHGEDAARVPAAPSTRGHPQGAQRARRERRRRARSTTTGPRPRVATSPRP